MKLLARKLFAFLMSFAFLVTVMLTNVCINNCIVETKDSPLVNESPAEIIFVPHPITIRHNYRRDEDI